MPDGRAGCDAGRPGDAASPLAGSVRLAAVGDILLAADASGRLPPRDPAALFADVRTLWQGCDVVFGNLECTLPGTGATVPTEPRVVSTADLVRAVRDAGFTVVTLANNHMFDCLQAGFHRVRDLLRELRIAFFGAGDDLEEAEAPAIVEVRGVRLAFLGAADERSGAFRCFAGPGRCGVAPFDADRLAGRIRALRADVDHVIVSLHWGEERFRIPAPDQVRQARALAEAGASLVLGHHPHVIQGMERHGDRRVPIAYSLGNFVACDVPYSDGDAVTWNTRERTGCLLLADLTPAGAVDVKQVPTYDGGERVRPEVGGSGEVLIARANAALKHAAWPGRYAWEALCVKVLRPARAHLRWSRLRKLRWTHVRSALAGLREALRGK